MLVQGAAPRCFLLAALVSQLCHAQEGPPQTTQTTTPAVQATQAKEIDCFEACKDKGEKCDFCGEGQACCRVPAFQEHFDNPKACDNAPGGLLRQDIHTCVPIDDKTETVAHDELLHVGEDCFAGCGNHAGFCDSFCGKGNACCRAGVLEPDAIECKAVPLGAYTKGDWLVGTGWRGYGFHQCVTPHTGEELWIAAGGSDTCNGFETERGFCPGQLPCPVEKLECVFTDWSEWAHNGDCSGLAYRYRAVARNATNDVPCTGPLNQSIAMDDPCCSGPAQVCVLSDWSYWTGCIGSTSQQIRNRQSSVQQCAGKYIPCVGNTTETLPCSVGINDECTPTEWGDWTSCSKTCQGGRQTRYRPPGPRFSATTGVNCSFLTLEQRSCGAGMCLSPVNCVFGPWSEWSTVEIGGKNGSEWRRSRQIAQEKVGTGIGCEGMLEEVAPVIYPTPCPIHSPPVWNPWGVCSRTCGGGQRIATGTLCNFMKVKKIEPCNIQSCTPAELDAQVGPWTEWTVCDAHCGAGERKRSRQLVQERKEGGQGLYGDLAEIEQCQGPPCVVQNCVWAAWQDWGLCSCTCDGGTKLRSRAVLTPPKHGGLACSAMNMSEVAPCNTQSCAGICIPQEWADWTPFSTCSATCGGGYKQRSRHVKTQTAAPPCYGDAALGNDTEWQSCFTDCGQDVNCSLSEWTAWSSCSTACFGLKHRSRVVAVAARGKGLPCVNSTKEIMSCNESSPLHPDPAKDCIQPEVKKADCILDTWSEWQACSASCGGGLTTRSRDVDNLPCVMSDTPTQPPLEELKGCNMTDCPKVCTNCTFSSWSEWTACPTCEGFSSRDRSVQTFNNDCGKPCDHDSLHEVVSCFTKCDQLRFYFCAWSDWEALGTCSRTCGAANKLRSRQLKAITEKAMVPSTNTTLIGPVASAEQCHARQSETAKCEVPSCESTECPEGPVDCKYGDWSDWVGGGCTGICERSRSVKTPNNACGKACPAGPLIETKECPNHKCNGVVNCTFGPWSFWSHCASSLSQRTRSREISGPPANGGNSCVGALQETESCGQSDRERSQECSFTPWAEWGECGHKCGGEPVKDAGVNQRIPNAKNLDCSFGMRERVRQPHPLVSSVGEGCLGNLHEIQECIIGNCSHDDFKTCVIQGWADWSICGFGGLQQRSRQMGFEAAELTEREAAKLKNASQTVQQRGCNAPPVNCSVSEWTEWSACSDSCGYGKEYRHRQVNHMPTSGGTECPSELQVIRPCNRTPGMIEACGSKSDCEFKEWADWGVCTRTCGEGMQERAREIKSTASLGGMGCDGATKEMRDCPSLDPCHPDIDCEWGEWQAWSTCSASCGGGIMTRDRGIEKFPWGSGEYCEALTMKEAASCNTHPCGDCKNGTWAEWSDWTLCSATCVGGVRYRHRDVATEAEGCGYPAEGLFVDYENCNTGAFCTAAADCQFSQWTEWSGCSATCRGYHQRSRQIAAQRRESGKPCNGSMDEIAECNPSFGLPAPAGCPEESPCVPLAWSEWSTCSASCGLGQQTRERHLPPEPAGGYSLPCDMDALTVVRECNAGACVVPKPVDCRWSDWEDWSACTRCAGQRTRSRTVAQVSVHGGKTCEGVAMQDTGVGCERLCGLPLYCGWQDWQEWGACSSHCGPAYRERRRELSMGTRKPPEVQLAEENTVLQRKLAGDSAQRRLELVMAFVAGTFTLAIAGALLRVGSSVLGARQPAGDNFMISPRWSRDTRHSGFAELPQHIGSLE
mmetsp:Transcript_43604/g.100521  ORF Transcript_43604/g.100521 Transcript_43604/m.100521 type:complete len:1740 (-) Transcript_43604:73-5292(-)